jgi:hypothetical protein
MAVFPATYFTYSVQYPESGTRIQLGGSYQFDALPDAPDQRIFMLNVQGMAYFTDAGGVIDTVINPDRNMAGLEAFYNTHKRATAFTFNHPIYGAVSCKFLNPLKIPEGIAGGGGNIATFSVELIEQP